MLQGGLVSISFRNLSPEAIIQHVSDSPLTVIEWGGDVHAPHGDLRTAEKIQIMMAGNGLECPSYGSYYRVGESERDGLTFRSVLDTASVLKTPTIRVWAGKKGSDAADETYWQTVVDDSRRIADMAADVDVKVAYEYHRNTLTDTNEAAQKLLRLVGHDNIYSYWQPPVDTSFEYRLEGLRALGNRLCHLHVYHWDSVDGSIVRRPLAEGRKHWENYLSIASALPYDCCAMLEFIEDNDPKKFLRDAETLFELISDASQTSVLKPIK